MIKIDLINKELKGTAKAGDIKKFGLIKGSLILEDKESKED